MLTTKDIAKDKYAKNHPEMASPARRGGFTLRRILAAACILMLACLAPVFAAQEDSTFKVMTQNMDSGTDLGFALYGLQQPDPRPYVDLTLLEADASDIPGRASYLAAEIASAKPHLVSLQEVTLWRTGLTPATATTVRYDQLQLLMDALQSLGAHYRVVAVNTLTDISLPTTAAGPGAVRYTDRDVLLARSDLRSSEFLISDVHTHIYRAALTVGDFTVRRGYITALVRFNNKLFYIADTHLENQWPGIPATAVIQHLQASELLEFMRNRVQPVILTGDYNADAIYGTSGPGPDNTDTVAFIESAGYADSWATYNPGSPGATWPLFLEDQTPPNFFTNTTPWERIDLIFYKSLGVANSVQIGAGQGFPDAASDHVGVMTTFQFGDQRQHRARTRPMRWGDSRIAPPANTASGLWPSDHVGVAVRLETGD
jgi:endonuclease/exonuclease/phosphatase family metal-dependent hydrolase